MATTGPLSHIDISVGYPDRSIPFYDAFLKALGYRRWKISAAGVVRRTADARHVGTRVCRWFALRHRSASGAAQSRDRRYDRYEPGPHHIWRFTPNPTRTSIVCTQPSSQWEARSWTRRRTTAEPPGTASITTRHSSPIPTASNSRCVMSPLQIREASRRRLPGRHAAVSAAAAGRSGADGRSRRGRVSIDPRRAVVAYFRAGGSAPDRLDVLSQHHSEHHTLGASVRDHRKRRHRRAVARQRATAGACCSTRSQFAWKEGCYKAMLQTGSKQESTHAFYRACGFRADEKTGYVARPV